MEDKKETEEDFLKKRIESLKNFHSKKLEQLKKSLEINGLKPITKQLIEGAIKDKEELLKQLNK